jgi:hypothetical protein
MLVAKNREGPMREFNKRDMLIFAICLLIGTALIGLGMAYLIQFKQRILPSSQPAHFSNSIRCAGCREGGLLAWADGRTLRVGLEQNGESGAGLPARGRLPPGQFCHTNNS